MGVCQCQGKHVVKALDLKCKWDIHTSLKCICDSAPRLWIQSPLTSTMEDGSLNATQHIVAVARRAQQLLKQQQEIERQVEER